MKENHINRQDLINDSMVMEGTGNGKTYYALYIGAALLDCYPVESEKQTNGYKEKCETTSCSKQRPA